MISVHLARKTLYFLRRYAIMDSIVKKQTVSCNGRGEMPCRRRYGGIYEPEKTTVPPAEACGNAGNGKRPDRRQKSRYGSTPQRCQDRHALCGAGKRWLAGDHQPSQGAGHSRKGCDRVQADPADRRGSASGRCGGGCLRHIRFAGRTAGTCCRKGRTAAAGAV